MGLWFYYMRGCSDLHLNVGRTLAVRNRCEAAILLEQRASRLTLSHDTAIKRVAARLEKLRFGGNAREYAAVLQRARERLGVPNGNYAWLLRECAAGSPRAMPERSAKRASRSSIVAALEPTIERVGRQPDRPGTRPQNATKP